MIKIILNADDFGKSTERNRAIDDAFKQGLIKSIGLIVTGVYLQDAIELANSGGYVDKLHIHFNLAANLMHENSEDAPITNRMKKDPFFCKEGKFLQYHGLPNRIVDIRKWRIVYHELVAQYKKFKDVTDGKADYKHIDFHLWYNLSMPVSIALNLFTIKFRIDSVRYFGVHQKFNKRDKLYRLLSWNPFVKYIPSTNIDYYISNKQLFAGNQMMELYCHPNYKEGVFLDDSPSYINHERQPMIKQLQMLQETGDIEFISWEDITCHQDE